MWNEARRAALKPYWPAIAAWSGALVVVFVLCSWVMVVAGVPAFVSGVLLGAGLATYGAALHTIADLVGGEHNNKYGAHGEEATAAELRSRAMWARGWRVIDAIPFHRCDVDHVAIRAGLAVAIETKWTNTPWEIVGERLISRGDPLAQARSGADKIRRELSRALQIDVHAVVAVWGRGAESLPRDVSYVDGVWIVRGRALASIDTWLEGFGAARPTGDDVDAAIQILNDFVLRRDEREATQPTAVSS